MWPPFAKHEGKIYPLDHMENVVAKLSGESKVKIFLFGSGERERDILSVWQERYPHVITLADKRHGFALELALMSHLDVMISMDSANMHLASLVAVPVVSVWGATHPCCGFLGVAPERSQRGATAARLPALFHLRQQAVPPQGLCLYGDSPVGHCRAGETVESPSGLQRVIAVSRGEWIS